MPSEANSSSSSASVTRAAKSPSETRSAAPINRPIGVTMRFAVPKPDPNRAEKDDERDDAVHQHESQLDVVAISLQPVIVFYDLLACLRRYSRILGFTSRAIPKKNVCSKFLLHVELE